MFSLYRFLATVNNTTDCFLCDNKSSFVFYIGSKAVFSSKIFRGESHVLAISAVLKSQPFTVVEIGA